MTCVCGQTAPDVTAIEQRALAARRAIKWGVVELHSEMFMRRAGGEQHFNVDTKIWFDTNAARVDCIRPLRDASRAEGSSSFRELNSFDGKQHIFWSTERASSLGNTPVEIKQLQYETQTKADVVVDPRLIGLAIEDSANLVNCRLESTLLGRADRDEPTIAADKIHGADCWKIAYRMKKGVAVRYWIDPARGDSVVRMESEFDRDGTHYKNLLNVDVAYLDAAKIWFPAGCTYQRLENDRVTKSEQLTVRVVSLNEPIDPAVFTLSGMDIPPGTHVARVPSDGRGELVWNGDEIVPFEDASSASSGWFSRRNLLIGVSVACALVASIAVWRYLKA